MKRYEIEVWTDNNISRVFAYLGTKQAPEDRGRERKMERERESPGTYMFKVLSIASHV